MNRYLFHIWLVFPILCSVYLCYLDICCWSRSHRKSFNPLFLLYWRVWGQLSFERFWVEPSGINRRTRYWRALNELRILGWLIIRRLSSWFRFVGCIRETILKTFAKEYSGKLSKRLPFFINVCQWWDKCSKSRWLWANRIWRECWLPILNKTWQGRKILKKKKEQKLE